MVNISKILIASGNKGKLLEISKLLNEIGIKSVFPDQFNLEEPEENGDSFEENSIIKAEYYGEKTGIISLSDDSGLCIDHLQGRPGVMSARWAKDKNGNNDFFTAFTRIKDELITQGIDPNKHLVRANFVCNLTLYFPENKTTKSFEGRIDGRIILPPRGEKGFGYDPIFIANGLTKTFGEILPENKELISHRSKAFNQLKQFLSCL